MSSDIFENLEKRIDYFQVYLLRAATFLEYMYDLHM